MNIEEIGKEYIQFLLSEVKRWKDAYNSEFSLKMDLVSDKEDLKDEVKQLQEKLDNWRNEIVSKSPEEREYCKGCSLPAEVKRLREGIGEVMDGTLCPTLQNKG